MLTMGRIASDFAAGRITAGQAADLLDCLDAPARERVARRRLIASVVGLLLVAGLAWGLVFSAGAISR